MFIFFLCGFVIIQISSADESASSAKILSSEFDNDGTGTYYFAFQTSDGTQRSEQGILKNANTPEETQVVVGTYIYTDPDKSVYQVNYTADERGFHPTVALIRPGPKLLEAKQRIPHQIYPKQRSLFRDEQEENGSPQPAHHRSPPQVENRLGDDQSEGSYSDEPTGDPGGEPGDENSLEDYPEQPSHPQPEEPAQAGPDNAQSYTTSQSTPPPSQPDQRSPPTPPEQNPPEDNHPEVYPPEENPPEESDDAQESPNDSAPQPPPSYGPPNPDSTTTAGPPVPNALSIAGLETRPGANPSQGFHTDTLSSRRSLPQQNNFKNLLESRKTNGLPTVPQQLLQEQVQNTLRFDGSTSLGNFQGFNNFYTGTTPRSQQGDFGNYLGTGQGSGVPTTLPPYLQRQPQNVVRYDVRGGQPNNYFFTQSHRPQQPALNYRPILGPAPENILTTTQQPILQTQPLDNYVRFDARAGVVNVQGQNYYTGAPQVLPQQPNLGQILGSVSRSVASTTPLPNLQKQTLAAAVTRTPIELAPDINALLGPTPKTFSLSKEQIESLGLDSSAVEVLRVNRKTRPGEKRFSLYDINSLL